MDCFILCQQIYLPEVVKLNLPILYPMKMNGKMEVLNNSYHWLYLKVSDQCHDLTTSPLEECSLHLLDGWSHGWSGYINVRRHAQLPVCNWGHLTQPFTIRGSTVTCSDLVSMADKR